MKRLIKNHIKVGKFVVAALAAIAVIALTVSANAATWYVRDAAGSYGAEDGTTYATAFKGWADIVWGASGVKAGDTLYVCGTNTIASAISPGANGSAGSPIVIRGDYIGDPGVISGHRMLINGRSYLDVINLTFTSSADGTGTLVIYTSNNLNISGCTVTRGATDNHGIYCHSSASVSIANCNISGFNGSYKGGIFFTYNTTPNSAIAITGNTVSDVFYGVYFSGNSSTISSNTLIGKTGSKLGSGIIMPCGSNINITGNTIADNSATGFERGIYVQGSTDGNCQVTALTVNRGAYNGNNESGIEITGKCSGIAINGPGTTNSNGGGTHGTGIEIYSSSATYYPQDVMVTNWTSNNNTDATGTDDGIGYRFDDNSYNCTLRNVRASGNLGAGISFNSSKGKNAVIGALLVGNNTAAISNEGNVYFSGAASDSRVYNSTLIGSTIGVAEDAGAGTLNIVKNCIISGATKGFKSTDGDMIAQGNIVYGASTAYDGVTAGVGSSTSDPKLDGNYKVTRQSPCYANGMIVCGAAFPKYPPPPE